MTSTTLILIGSRGVFEQGYRELDRRKKSLNGNELIKAENKNWPDMTRRVAGRFLTIGLPFFATSKLGAPRVALVTLVGLASNIIAVDDETVDLTRAKTWRLLFTHRKWTMGSVVFQLVCDFANLTSDAEAIDTCLGYLSLGLSLFVMPPPFPSSTPRASAITSSAPTSETTTSAVLPTPWETPPQLQSTTNIPTASPLISSPGDTELTLWSGAALGLMSIVAFLIFGPSGVSSLPAQLGYTFIASTAAALAFTAADPKSLRCNKGLGLVLGSLLSSFALAQLGVGLWSMFVYQSIFTGISFAATRFDTPTVSSSVPYSKHQHRHIHDSKLHANETAKMSGFSQFVLRNVPEWQLLHSILIEKDSRRIFYFMWSVPRNLFSPNINLARLK